MAYYNAAAHLRRAHFKPKTPSRKNKDGENRGGKAGGDWPPMSELKYWMKEVKEVAAPETIGPEDSSETFRDISEDIEDNIFGAWDFQGMESAPSLFPDNPFQDQISSDQQGFDSFPTTFGPNLDGMDYSSGLWPDYRVLRKTSVYYSTELGAPLRGVFEDDIWLWA